MATRKYFMICANHHEDNIWKYDTLKEVEEAASEIRMRETRGEAGTTITAIIYGTKCVVTDVETVTQVKIHL